ncbi:MAG: patatin-like phospholipase family protein [Bacteroides sp.]|nr:patatin-like phospholipase family protein [Bacteroides sp.]
MDKQKIALVLSMGGARGIAHIGVIEELIAHGYEITSIVGSSMGAMVGAMYATNRLEECKQWLCTWDKRKLWQLADLSLSRDGLVKGDRFIKELKQIIPDTHIEDLPMPYAALATDIAHECEVKFDHGSLFDAIRASISIPMVFRPFRKDDMILVDGGILNPLPLNHAIRTEGDLLIAVDVNASIESGKKKRMSPYQQLTLSSRLMMQQIARHDIERHRPDLLIQMSGNDYDMMEFYRAAPIIESGRLAARKALELFQRT